MFIVTLNKDFMAGMFISLLAMTLVGGIIAKNEKH